MAKTETQPKTNATARCAAGVDAPTPREAMPRKGRKEKQDLLDWSSDEDDDGAGPSGSGGGKSSKNRTSGKPGWGGWGGNKGHVHGLDRKLAAAEMADADAKSSAKRHAFALRDAPASDERRATRGTNRDARDVSASAPGVDARRGGAPETLAAMFGDALPADAIEDVYRQCDYSVENAVEALLALTTNVEETAVGETTTAAAAPSPQSSSERTAPDLWDALPAELRLLVLDHLGPKDAARAARTCRDFAETVRAWRANKKHVAPPAALTTGGVCSLLCAYPNLESVSLRRCAKGCLRDVADVFRVLRAAASGPSGRTLRSIDLEGCDVTDADVVALLETFATFPETGAAAEYPISELKLGKCARVTDKALAALAMHPAGRALRSVSVAGTAVTAAGAKTALGGRAAGGLPLLERFDFSGCLDAKGAVALPPLASVVSLRAMYLPALTVLNAQLPKHAGLASLHVSQCVNLTSLHVSAASLLRLNASQCKRLSRLELHCASLEALNLQHCAALTGPLAFTCRGLTEELNVSGCASLRTESLRAMAAGAPSLRRVRLEGCASLEGELAFASRALREVVADGCGRLESLRVAAPVLRVSARRCKNLTAVWIEPPPEPEEGEDCNCDLDAGTVSDALRLDLRNCAALTRLVGIRAAAMEGRLDADLVGCLSLPRIARPPERMRE